MFLLPKDMPQGQGRATFSLLPGHPILPYSTAPLLVLTPPPPTASSAISHAGGTEASQGVRSSVRGGDPPERTWLFCLCPERLCFPPTKSPAAQLQSPLRFKSLLYRKRLDQPEQVAFLLCASVSPPEREGLIGTPPLRGLH